MGPVRPRDFIAFSDIPTLGSQAAPPPLSSEQLPGTATATTGPTGSSAAQQPCSLAPHVAWESPKSAERSVQPLCDPISGFSYPQVTATVG